MYSSDKKHIEWQRNGKLMLLDPWEEVALTWTLMCKFRKGPWTGRIGKDLRIKISRLLLMCKPNLENVTYRNSLETFPDPIVGKKELWYQSKWLWHTEDDRKICSACEDCNRPIFKRYCKCLLYIPKLGIQI